MSDSYTTVFTAKHKYSPLISTDILFTTPHIDSSQIRSRDLSLSLYISQALYETGTDSITDASQMCNNQHRSLLSSNLLFVAICTKQDRQKVQEKVTLLWGHNAHMNEFIYIISL